MEHGEDPEHYKVYEIKNKEGKKTCRRSQPAASPSRHTHRRCYCRQGVFFFFFFLFHPFSEGKSSSLKPRR